MKIYVGTCGTKIGLKRYVELFNTLEINATFYRFPSKKTLENWEKVFRKQKDFALAFKAFQGLTHPLSSPTWRRTKLSSEEKQRFQGQVGCLKLNPTTEAFLQKTLEMARRVSARFVLFQLPRNCEKEKEGFADFFSALRGLSGESKKLSFGLEIRWQDRKLLEDLFQGFGIIPVFDPLLFSEYLEPFRDLPLLYFRLHGALEGGRLNYHKCYEEEELLRLRELTSKLGAREVFILFNNIYMHQDALRFKALLTP